MGLRGVFGAALCAVVVATLTSGCLNSSVVHCGDQTCPDSYQCSPTDPGRCVPSAAITVCAGVADDTACSANGASGTCVGGVCEVVVCGNGIVDPGEVCDDGNVAGGDGCSATCRSTETCGNGVVDVVDVEDEEGCDCGVPGAVSPLCDGPNSDDPDAECSTDCRPRGCGDGELNGGERCEQSLAFTETCRDVGFHGGTLGCNGVCQFDTSACSERCGDNVVNGLPGDEVCDGGPPPETCLDLGFDAGTMACSSLCQPQLAGCHRLGWRASSVFTANAIWGAADNDVWIAGSAGRVARWNGAQWTTGLIPGEPSQSYATWGTSGSNFFVAVDRSIQHWNGATWTEVVAPNQYELYAIHGSGPDHAVAVGREGRMVVMNGGTWTEETLDPPAQLEAVQVLSPTERVVLARARNGNADIRELRLLSQGTWDTVSVPMFDVAALWAFAIDDIYVGGTTLVHWDGARWETISFGLSENITAIAASGENDILVTFAGTAGTVARFDGQAWRLTTTGVQNASAAWVGSPTSGFVAGATIARYQGDEIADGPIGKALSIRGAGGAVTAFWVVGDAGFVRMHDGVQWNVVPVESAESLQAASGNFVVGAAGTILRWDGSRLARVPSTITTRLRAVWTEPTDDDKGWAVGEQGTLIRLDGTSATQVPLSTTADLRAVHGFAADHVVAVGKNGTQVTFDGSQWTESPDTTPGMDLTGIYGASADDYWTVRSDGNAIYLDHFVGGAPGIQVLALTAKDGATIAGTAADNVYVSIYDGAQAGIWRWNGGPSWELTIPEPGLSFIAIPRSASALPPYVGGEELRLATTDAQGRRLYPVFRATPGDMDAIVSFSRDSSYAVASVDGQSYVVHFDGRVWARVSGPEDCNEPPRIGGTSDTNFWIACGANVARRVGSGWQTFTIPDLKIAAIASTGPDDVWVAGSLDSNGVAYHFDGTDWSPLGAAIPNDAIQQLVVLSPTNVLGRLSHAVARWDGTQWTLLPELPDDSELRALAARTGALARVGTENGGIWRYDGTQWLADASPSVHAITDLVYVTPTEIFASNAGGQLLRSTGDGRWDPVRVPPDLTTGQSSKLTAMSYADGQLFLAAHRDAGREWPLVLHRDTVW